MNKKSKVLATSIASIAMCTSLAIGGTYALFTDKANVNIAVSSGKVNVEATVENAKVYSGVWNETKGDYDPVEQNDLTFANDVDGPSVAFNDATHTLAIEQMTPTDKVTFDIRIHNGSDVKAKYQTVIGLVEGVELFTGLTVTVGEGENINVYDGMTAYSAWNEIRPNAEDIIVPVSIELPAGTIDEETWESDSNQYMGKSCEISYSVRAVQANANVGTANAETGVTYIYTANDLTLFANSVNNGNSFAGKTVKLMSDIDLGSTATTYSLRSANNAWTPIGNSTNKFQGEFDGNGKKISNLYVEGGKGLGLFGYVGGSAYIHNLTIDGAYVAGEDYVGAVVGSGYFGKDGIQNCVVKNATIIATPYLTADGIYDGGAKAGVVAGYVSNCDVIGNSAANSSVSAYRDLGGIVGMMSGENRAVVATNNTVNNVTLTYLAAGKYVDNKVNGYMAAIAGRTNNVTVTENTEKNVHYNDKVDVNTLTQMLVGENYYTVSVGMAKSWYEFENVPGKIEADIYIPEDLYAFSMMYTNGDLSKTSSHSDLKIINDLNFAGKEWAPIGRFYTNIHGNGKTISNLNDSLLGCVYDCQVDDLTLENVTTEGSASGIIAKELAGDICIKDVTIAGTNTVTYKADDNKDNWPDKGYGIGAICGVSLIGCSGIGEVDVNIAGTVTLYYGENAVFYNDTNLENLSVSKEFGLNVYMQNQFCNVTGVDNIITNGNYSMKASSAEEL